MDFDVRRMPHIRSMRVKPSLFSGQASRLFRDRICEVNGVWLVSRISSWYTTLVSLTHTSPPR